MKPSMPASPGPPLVFPSPYPIALSRASTNFSKKEGDVYKLVRTVITNGTGRSDEPLLIGESYQAGSYELLMHFDEYFARKEAKLPTPPFLSKVPIRIRIADISQRIHLPIQFGPWSYTYSRGS